MIAVIVPRNETVWPLGVAVAVAPVVAMGVAVPVGPVLVVVVVAPAVALPVAVAPTVAVVPPLLAPRFAAGPGRRATVPKASVALTPPMSNAPRMASMTLLPRNRSKRLTIVPFR